MSSRVNFFQSIIGMNLVKDSHLAGALSLSALLFLVTSACFGQDLYISANHKVLRYDGTIGAFVGIFVSADANGPGMPQGLSFDDLGNLYVCSSSLNEVKGYTSTGAPLAAGGIFVTANSGGLAAPHGLKFDRDGNLYVASGGAQHGILQYDVTGAFNSTFVTNSPAITPLGITFGGPAGDLYITSANTIHRYDKTTGAHIGAGPFATDPAGHTHYDLAFGPDSNLYVTSYESNSVLRFNGTTGAPLPSAGNSGADFVSGNLATNGGLKHPLGLAFGPDGNLYVAGSSNSNVLRFNSATGAFINIFVSGNGLVDPTYITFGRSNVISLGTSVITPPSNNGCIDFNDSTMQGCVEVNLRVEFAKPGPQGSADTYLKCTDQSGISNIRLPQPYLGNWKTTSNCARTMSYDVQIYNDGDNAHSNNYSIGIKVIGGGSFQATFTPPVLMSEPSGGKPGWHHVVVPLSAAIMPAGWTMTSGTAANWSAMISNITSATIGFDPGGYQTEVYGLDNICTDIACAPGPCKPKSGQ